MTQFRDEVEHRLPFLTFLVDEIERLDRILYDYRIRIDARLEPDHLRLVYEAPNRLRYTYRLSHHEIGFRLGARNDIAELFGLPAIDPARVDEVKRLVGYITEKAVQQLIKGSLSVPR